MRRRKKSNYVHKPPDAKNIFFNFLPIQDSEYIETKFSIIILLQIVVSHDRTILTVFFHSKKLKTVSVNC